MAPKLDRALVEQERDQLLRDAVRDDHDSLQPAVTEKTQQLYRCPNLSCQHETAEPLCVYNKMRRSHEIRCPECQVHIRDGKPEGFFDFAGYMTRDGLEPAEKPLDTSDYAAIMNEDVNG